MASCEVFGLPENVLGATPDPQSVHLMPSHREALAALRYGIEARRGFLALIGAEGAGKTSLLLRLMHELRGSAETIYRGQTQGSGADLMRSLVTDLGAEPGGDDIVRLHRQFNEAIVARNSAGQCVLIVIDDAHDLSDELLEALRLLSDFESTHTKLMQIVLSGQEQLLTRLENPRHRQLRQRISVIARLKPLASEVVPELRVADEAPRTEKIRGSVAFSASAAELMSAVGPPALQPQSATTPAAAAVEQPAPPQVALVPVAFRARALWCLAIASAIALLLWALRFTQPTTVADPTTVATRATAAVKLDSAAERATGGERKMTRRRRRPGGGESSANTRPEQQGETGTPAGIAPPADIIANRATHLRTPEALPAELPAAANLDAEPVPPGVLPGELRAEPAADVLASAVVPRPLPTLGLQRSEGATSPKLLHQVHPEYPRNLRNWGVVGDIVLKVQVAASGKVNDVSVVRGNPVLARSAVTAVRQWEFEPATLNGLPTAAETTVIFRFRFTK